MERLSTGTNLSITVECHISIIPARSERICRIPSLISTMLFDFLRAGKQQGWYNARVRTSRENGHYETCTVSNLVPNINMRYIQSTRKFLYALRFASGRGSQREHSERRRSYPSPYVLPSVFPLWVGATDTNEEEVLTNDEGNNLAGVATSPNEVIHQGCGAI